MHSRLGCITVLAGATWAAGCSSAAMSKRALCVVHRLDERWEDGRQNGSVVQGKQRVIRPGSQELCDYWPTHRFPDWEVADPTGVGRLLAASSSNSVPSCPARCNGHTGYETVLTRPVLVRNRQLRSWRTQSGMRPRHSTVSLSSSLPATRSDTCSVAEVQDGLFRVSATLPVKRATLKASRLCRRPT